MQVQQLLSYLQANHDKAVSLAALAKVCGYSPFHFQRLCTQQLGLGPGKLNELIRLHRAYHLLLFRRWLSVTDIAFDCGYQSSDTFSRAFKRVTGYTPQQFKQGNSHLPSPLQPYLTRWNKELAMPVNAEFADNVLIHTLPEIQVCALRHTGQPARLNNSIQRFIGWRRENKLPPASYRTFNFLHNDPTTVAPDAFCFDLACERPSRAVLLADDMRYDTIPAGRYACLKVVGGDSYLESAVNYLTTDFLDAYNEEMADFPVIVERVTFYPEVPYHQAENHIFLLLSK
ncbi:AraC family transcriptional regulator [Alteromonas lipolytica]|uniref:HTH araC/xylS-type domain-containing protein n=1 Tax=Alteromonas lipolytica TaxID=1856405 RepID=A0A1E8FH20_9ALTE|nr:GyrI-like domain-containing protein [Alteromonas lipolytica]OFI35235.1 hypothetical protein BFC17_16985 [Alteromonas lipolytica]GGF57825.1 AraC family transcriptional regulator [Alteromonas lipolytica]